jgi:hypothetical protein
MTCIQHERADVAYAMPMYDGLVPQPLPRAWRRQEQAADRENVDRILREVSDEPPSSGAGATAAGDWRRLRGIPAIGRGVAGAIRGSRPGDSLFRS